MNQDDIYNLLLILLLMSNEKDNCENQCQSTRGSLNELILTSMLLSSCNSRDGLTTTATSNNSCSCRRTDNQNTTF